MFVLCFVGSISICIICYLIYEDRKKGRNNMRKEYDFSNGIKNPYAEKLTKFTVTLKLDKETLQYFQGLAEKQNIPYQVLINSFLNDCAKEKREIILD